MLFLNNYYFNANFCFNKWNESFPADENLHFFKPILKTRVHICSLYILDIITIGMLKNLSKSYVTAILRTKVYKRKSFIRSKLGTKRETISKLQHFKFLSFTEKICLFFQCFQIIWRYRRLTRHQNLRRDFSQTKPCIKHKQIIFICHFSENKHSDKMHVRFDVKIFKILGG